MLRFAFVTALSLLSPTLLGTLSPELSPARDTIMRYWLRDGGGQCVKPAPDESTRYG